MLRTGIMVLLLSLAEAVMANDITVTHPAAGQVLVPGQSVELRLTFPMGFTPADLGIDWVKVGTFDSPYQNLTTPPFDTITVQVPNELAGPILLNITSTSVDGQYASADQPVIIVPSEAPTSIVPTVLISNLAMPGVGSPGSDREAILPRGAYADGTLRDISSAATGTTYTSSNAAIATVDAEGVIQAVAPGLTFVTIENSGVREYTAVLVEDPVTGVVPTQDLAGKLQFTAGGFRLDRYRGVYVQLVTVTNVSQEVLHPTIAVLVDNLPEGVKLHTSRLTRTIAPIGTPWTRMEHAEPKPFAPGQTATLLLEFDNPNGLPISYTLHPYWSANP